MNNIATIDISSLFRAGATENGARAGVDSRIGEAVRAHGGFVISGYPGAEEVDARARTMLRFFDLSEADKRAVANRSSDPDGKCIYRGYTSYLKPGSWAYNEMFDIGPRQPTPAPTEGMRVFAEANIWPKTEPVPGWRQAMHDYYDALELVGTAVVLSLCRSFGIEESALRQRFEGGNSTLRLINYPTPPKPANVVDEEPEAGVQSSELRLAAGRHTDSSGLSLLWQREQGLQGQAPDGVWRDVPVQANCVSVHLGDVLEVMTDGRVPATPHRVIDHGVARQSIGFFLEPRLDANLTSVLGGEVDDDLRGSYGWALQRRYSGYQEFHDLIPDPDLSAPS